MDDEDGAPPSVEEFVEYCRTQVGLLSGRIETMTAEVDELLDDIDEQIGEMRAQLERRSDEVKGTATPPSTEGPAGADADLPELDEFEATVEEKQALAEAKRARIDAFRELSGGYADLAEELESDVDDGREAMKRVVRFEADRDAPAYFEDVQTVYEAVADSQDSKTE